MYYPSQKVNRIQDQSPTGATILEVQGDSLLLAYDEGGTGYWPTSSVTLDPDTPNYAGLLAELSGSDLMDVVDNRETPQKVIGNRSGIAQSGGSNFLILATTASDQDNAYFGSTMLVTQGTGNNQAFICTGYVGATRRADFVCISGSGAAVTLDGTTRYRMYPLEDMHSIDSAAVAVWNVGRTTRQFMATLNTMVARYAPEPGATYGDTANLRTRFQDRLTAWVITVNFNSTDRDQLRAYLLQYVPTRGYLVP